MVQSLRFADMNRRRRQIYLLIIFAMSGLMQESCQCNRDSKKKGFEEIKKVENDLQHLKVLRFEEDVFSLDTSSIGMGMEKLSVKYGTFYEVWMRDVMGYSSVRDSIGLKRFLSNAAVRSLKDSVILEYPDLVFLEKELEPAFAIDRKMFSNHPQPVLVSVISEFGVGVFTVDTSKIGIGLDLFLGDDFIYYPQFFPKYICAKLKREFIGVNVMRVYYNAYFKDPTNYRGNLLNSMIEVGKQQYYLSKVLPVLDEEYLFGYTSDQLAWCKENEKMIWAFFNEKDLLYKENPLEIRRYVGEGPSSAGMPTEAPGNIGTWVGYRIVKSYVEGRGSKLSYEEVINTEPGKLMRDSGYKPK